MFIENSIILYRVLKPLIYYLFSYYLSITIKTKYSNIYLDNIDFYFYFGNFDDRESERGLNAYYYKLFNKPDYHDENEKEKIEEINKKLLTSYDEETNKNYLLLTFNKPFNLTLSLDYHINLPKKTLNDKKKFKSDECVIYLNNSPNVLFCDCGHLCLCEECDEVGDSYNCPVCQTKNIIKKILDKTIDLN